MVDFDDSMRSGSRLGEKMECTEILMSLLSQKKILWESGLETEDPDVIEVIDSEIESCEDFLWHFEEEKLLM